MNKFKYLLTGLAASLALASVASAQTAIYISGAPAVRKAWNIAISNTLALQSTGSPTITTAFTGSSFNSANQVVWKGGNISGTAVTINASWTGSTAGIQSVAQNPAESNTALKVAFLPDNATGTGLTLDNSNLQYPHFTLSDSFQSTVPFHGHVTITSPATDYVTLDEASPLTPAITAYKFVANKGSPATLNNITTNLAQLFFTKVGGIKLAQFTGANADRTIQVFPVGRDIGSGARYILLAESGIGTANSTKLRQYTATNSGTGGTISGYTLSSAGTINLISFVAGNGGYSSFTPVLQALSCISTNAIGYFVTYVTDSDADTAVGAGAHLLSWNGVSYPTGAPTEGANNTAPVVISEGQYTYWSYLHTHYNQAYIHTNHPLSETFANAVNADLSTDTGTGAILTSDVTVGRLTDGGSVSF